MKFLQKTTMFLVVLLGGILVSCDDFLDQPAQDNYNADNFITNDNTCYQAVNALYNVPWSDFSRGFLKVGDGLAGTYFFGDSGDDNMFRIGQISPGYAQMKDMSYSLWTVNAYANTAYDKVKAASGPSEAVKNACLGEALTWKAMAYFFLVRVYGAVPIIHNNSDIIAANSYNDQYKARIETVYEYIIMTLEKAIELLPEKDKTGTGRIDRYAAKALLAKVYLAKSGFDPETTTYESGSNPYIKTSAHQRNAQELSKAAEYAKDVILNSGRKLEPVFSDIFRGAYYGEESLIAWHWVAGYKNWTEQNFFQSDLAVTGFDETGNNWGGWAGPSVELEDAFDVSPLTKPDLRSDIDDRRKATMMMAGDKYDYFYTDRGGFEILKQSYTGYDDLKGEGQYLAPTGANAVKFLVGNDADHMKYIGTHLDRMAYGNYTQILRLADVYLIYVEAMIGNSGSTSDALACQAYYDVRHRSVKSYDAVPASVTFAQVWKERLLELATEGDRWYDYVRRFYYDPEATIAELNNQRRGRYWNLNTLYKTYYNDGSYQGIWDIEGAEAVYEPYDNNRQNFTTSSFTIPFPTEDVVQNPHLLEAPVEVDLSQFTY